MHPVPPCGTDRARAHHDIVACRRLAGAADAALYRRLRLECLARFPEHFGSSHGEESRKPRLELEAPIEQGEGDRFMIGAFAAGRLVGIAGFVREARAKAAHRGEIVHMYVDPAHHGRRVGERLLRAVVDAAWALEGVRQIELNVVATNKAARSLYERLGFRVHGEIPGCFVDGARSWNQLLMHLTRERWPAP
jgi:RimJ/RimL family protein N-acetyltransferase